MSDVNKVQNRILLECKSQKTSVTVFLMNGFRLRGVISTFDESVVVLMTDGVQQVIYKHAISTIVPKSPIAV